MAEEEMQAGEGSTPDEFEAAENTLEAVTHVTPALPTQPSYRKYRDARIVVPRSHGPLWKSRRNAGTKAQEPYAAAWDEAIKYYNNNQMSHRYGGGGVDNKSGNTRLARRLNEQHTETENVVFATVNAIVPSIYAKNPTIEITPNIQETPGDDDPQAVDLANFGRCCEKLVNTLANKNEAPGFFMKIKAKQAVIHAQLTNESWAEYGYTVKEHSSEQKLAELQALATALEVAEDETEIHRIEGDLLALQETIDALQPEGPFVRFRPGKDVIVDPDHICPQHSDANWIMYPQMFSTAYLNTVYGTPDTNGQYKLVYEPTHVLAAGETGAADEMINNFRLFDTGKSNAQSYGYEDEDSFRRAQRTKCWIVWDKITRRVYLYHDKDWTWPIWVWDDPYGLPNFFPLEKLAFIVPPVGARAMGETSYYLDQQDAINEINDELRRIRLWVRRNIFFNTNTITQDEFDKVMKGPDGTGRGLAIPDGHKLGDHIFSVPPPSANYIQIFDVQSKMGAIDRITGTSVIMRNEQFKTNTTNEAIGAYTSANQTRLDDKTDTTEDWIGRVYRGVLMLCVKFMPKETVVELLGNKIGQHWQNMEPRDFAQRFPMRIEGGSTQKPTSSAKKKEALGMAQTLGQFVRAAPGPVLEIMLRMLEKAFDEIVLTADDWKYIREAAMAEMNKGVSTGGGAPGAPGAGVQDLLGVIDQLPPPAKQAFITALSRGASARDALMQIIDAMKQQPQAA